MGWGWGSALRMAWVVGLDDFWSLFPTEQFYGSWERSRTRFCVCKTIAPLLLVKTFTLSLGSQPFASEYKNLRACDVDFYREVVTLHNAYSYPTLNTKAGDMNHKTNWRQNTTFPNSKENNWTRVLTGMHMVERTPCSIQDNKGAAFSGSHRMLELQFPLDVS